MKKHSLILYPIVLISMFFLTACPDIGGPEYSEGHFPDEPVNFKAVNSEFDDYNSALPQSGEMFPLCFSSTRKLAGSAFDGKFDVVYKPIEIVYDWESHDLYVGLSRSNNGSFLEMTGESINYALRKINKNESDEFGPYMRLIGDKTNAQTSSYYFNYFFLFSSDRKNGKQNIYFTENNDQVEYSDPKEVTFLNSDYDDAYPSFNEMDSGLYFCSNRAGNYDIYFAKVDFSGNDLKAVFSDTTQKKIYKVELFSSDSADKCPFILNNTLVFASNRAGGYGGYDLYYSKKINGKWSKPINFGPHINTPYDEYRPVIRNEPGFNNDFMIFSSNRPGGLGGFDLYYVGIDKIVK